MSSRRTIILVAAIVVAALATYVLLNYVHGVEDKAKPNPVPVYAISEEIKRGTPGLTVAMPGMMSSSGTKRMISFSGLPQLASAALVPEIAVSLMKDRRSTTRASLEVTREAIVRSLTFPVTVHAETHRHIDVALRDALRADVAVTRRAFDLGANVRRVIEPDVRLRGIAEHALPREITTLLSHLGDLTDTRAIGGNVSMAAHAGPHARKASHRPF